MAECLRTKIQNPSAVNPFALCKTYLSARLACAVVLMCVLAMIGLIAGVGGCVLVAEGFDSDFWWVHHGSALYTVGTVFLTMALVVWKLTRRSKDPPTIIINLKDQDKDACELLIEKLPEGNAEQKKQIKVASSEPDSDSDIDPLELPSSPMPSVKGRDDRGTRYRCEQCQSEFFGPNPTSQRVHIQCPSCNTITSIRPTYTITKIMCQYVFLAMVGIVCWIGGCVILVCGINTAKWLVPFGVALYCASVYVLITAVDDLAYMYNLVRYSVDRGKIIKVANGLFVRNLVRSLSSGFFCFSAMHLCLVAVLIGWSTA